MDEMFVACKVCYAVVHPSNVAYHAQHHQDQNDDLDNIDHRIAELNRRFDLFETKVDAIAYQAAVDVTKEVQIRISNHVHNLDKTSKDFIREVDSLREDGEAVIEDFKKKTEEILEIREAFKSFR